MDDGERERGSFTDLRGFDFDDQVSPQRVEVSRGCIRSTNLPYCLMKVAAGGASYRKADWETMLIMTMRCIENFHIYHKRLGL